MSTSKRCSQCKSLKGIRSFSRKRNGSIKKSCDPCLARHTARRDAKAKRRHERQQHREIQSAKAVLRLKHLPSEIQQKIYSFDPTYKTRFTTTVCQFKYYLNPGNLFIAKPKFRILFGSNPMYARCVGKYSVRVTQVESDFDMGTTSLIMPGHKLPLCFEPARLDAEYRDDWEILTEIAVSRDRYLQHASYDWEMATDNDDDE